MAWRFQIIPSKPGLDGVGFRLWLMLSYFTNLAAVMVVMHMAVAVFGPVRANVSAMVALSIFMVGLVYWQHNVLPGAKPMPFWYPGMLSDQGSPGILLNRVVPLLTTIWWLAYGDKHLRLRDLPLWTVPALLYCPYVLVRGAVTGIWPYRFLDLDKLGALQVAQNVGGLLLVFAVGGVGLWLLAAVLWRLE